MPPTRNDGEAMEANIVSELGKEFNVDEVYGTDSLIIGSLKTVDDFNSVTLIPSNLVAFDETMHENDKQPEREKPVESINNKGEDEAMTEDKDSVEVTIKNSSSRQNEKLYAAEGVLNTKLRKAEKKRRKKANKLALMEEDQSMEGDDDLKVDDVTNESAIDVGEGHNDDDGPVKDIMNNRFVLISEVE